MPGREEQLSEAVSRFVRTFGLHRPERTPCGFEASVAEAHALSELTAGPMRQLDLVTRLGLAKSTVSRVVTEMDDRGWVKRRPAQDDGRGVLLILTPAGQAAAEELAEARAVRMRALLDAVPPERRDSVIDVLTILEEAARVSNRTDRVQR
ncbi:MAG: MarR family winged helix-turn-helix transcriptional regulator [Actinomycetota bacterium]